MRKALKIAGIALLVIVGLGLIFVFTFLPGQFEANTNTVSKHAPYVISTEAERLHKTLVIGDLHSDSLLWDRDLLKRYDRGHVDIPRLQEGNVALQVFPTVTKSPSGQNYESNTGDSDNITLLTIIQRWPSKTRKSLTARALFQAEKLHQLESRAPDQLRIIRTKQDLEVVLSRRANGSMIVGGLLSFEGAHALDGKLENISALHEAGFRLMELHHFFDNKLGGSLHGTSKAGLSEFGRAAISEMTRLEIIIDVAHSSEAVVDDVLSMVSKPIIVSHTGIKGVCDSARNISDDHLKRIAAAGGLIGIGFWDGAVCDFSPAGVVNSIRYAIDLVGVDHVALGSDYDGATEVTFDASEIAILTQTMLDKGFTEQEIRAVMGGNMVRFLEEFLPK
jgi:microsomal dipeptidase-like Zn-dependent dipeptidase